MVSRALYFFPYRSSALFTHLTATLGERHTDSAWEILDRFLTFQDLPFQIEHHHYTPEGSRVLKQSTCRDQPSLFHSHPYHCLYLGNMSLIPLSPALSFCDTLSSPDLDLYLDSLSPLDSLPSPEMKEAWWTDEQLVCNASNARKDSMFDDHQGTCMSLMYACRCCRLLTSFISDITNANVLCTITRCHGCEAVKGLPAMIAQFLERSQLPLENIAVAYNILASPSISSLHCWHGARYGFACDSMRAKMIAVHGPEADASCQRALIILSALSVAVSFTEDSPRSSFYWSRQVAQGAFSTEQIGAMNRLLLAQLNWQIHPLAAPSLVRSAIVALSQSVEKSTIHHNTPPSFEDKPFRLLINPHTTIQYGLTTPIASPDRSLMEHERLSYLSPV